MSSCVKCSSGLLDVAVLEMVDHDLDVSVLHPLLCSLSHSREGTPCSRSQPLKVALVESALHSPSAGVRTGKLSIFSRSQDR